MRASTISSSISRALRTTTSRCTGSKAKSFRGSRNPAAYTRPKDERDRTHGLLRLPLPLGLPRRDVAGRGRKGRPDPAAVAVLFADAEPPNARAGAQYSSVGTRIEVPTPTCLPG